MKRGTCMAMITSAQPSDAAMPTIAMKRERSATRPPSMVACRVRAKFIKATRAPESASNSAIAVMACRR